MPLGKHPEAGSGEHPANLGSSVTGRELVASSRARLSTARLARSLSSGPAVACWRFEQDIGVETGAVAGVTGSSDLVDLDQYRVAVAVQRH